MGDNGSPFTDRDRGGCSKNIACVIIAMLGQMHSVLWTQFINVHIKGSCMSIHLRDLFT
jgi:hypothetical protein